MQKLGRHLKGGIVIVFIFIVTIFTYQNCSQSFVADTGSTLDASSTLNSSEGVFLSPEMSDLSIVLQKLKDRKVSLGYFGSVYGGDIEKMARLKTVSNFVFISDDWRWNNELNQSKSVAFIASALAEAEKNNFKAVINIYNFFFKHDGRNGLDDGLTLRPTRDQEWNLLKPILAKYEKNILALYIDEPYLLGRHNGHSQAQVKVMLDDLAGTVHRDLPNLRLMLVEATSQLQEGLVLPIDFHYFGLDCYEGFEKCHDGSIPGYYNFLLEKIRQLPGEKKLVLVPPAFADNTNRLTEVDLIEINKKYLRLAADLERVEIIMPFIWRWDNSPTVNALPVFKDFMTKVFDALVNPAPILPQGPAAPTVVQPTTTCSNYRPLEGSAVTCQVSLSSGVYRSLTWEVQYDNNKIAPVSWCDGQTSCRWDPVPVGYYVVRAKVVSMTGVLSWSDAIVDVKPIPIVINATTTCSNYRPRAGSPVTCSVALSSSAYKTLQWEVQYDNGTIAPVPSCAGKLQCSWEQVPAGYYVVRARVTSQTDDKSWSDAIVIAK